MFGNVCETKFGFKDATLAPKIIQGVCTTSTNTLFDQETNYGDNSEF